MFDKKILPLSDSLYRMARSILQDADEAHDAVQDLLMNLWEKRNELADVENLNAFVFRSLRNKSLDMLRKRRYNNEELDNTVSESNTPYEQTEQQDMVGRVHFFIEHLPELQRTIIRMRDVEGMEIQEIADITEITPNAVRVNLSRARQKIREQIIKENSI